MPKKSDAFGGTYFYDKEATKGLMKERLGRTFKENGTRKGYPSKLDKKVEEELIAEYQCLRIEIT